ncbi:MAG: acyl-CoA thioesterase [Ignavibacteria bacterium RIFOXYB2_FULL_35_12]|nr:MAG: acyl-CoA thioesterase [Ignavibacteria bacterium GWA2_36_19]OGU55795.1 MAG: acyl-CoA thioesterase [Ignavibacteria bacterium GWF2_35_20]OGU83042.1 MAG: acyl-CoA thioesterase [Ignavibacteria bacterium RIFOXYA2_FULL_35_9]OGU85313.1 MAG: acyl-CoA thioesterase [Ignavibacteria bacterium RIFOXYA12_FULL_35_25]OGU87079.1 MAG: acyl-CoA thioesterase [Ignavibacteria bacterium RIFOXYC12_FULL_35_11]OGU93510.1 MAG: acyl-CoA thioesterase [Ignavibacteria bacterium RIFOXYB12_FULL_35_14]OGV01715.1 MAG: a
MLKAKKVSESIITMTELVLPNHTNQLVNLLGGQLMQWIDICAALCGAKHNQNVCVTASVDRIDFHHPIKLGDAVTLVASINRVFRTSMEIGVKVYAESFKEGKRIHSNTAYLTFVAVDNDGKPTLGVEAIPESVDEKRRYEEALIRRENRLKDRIKQN